MVKVLFIISVDWTLVTHRLHLVKEAVEKGYDVAVLTNITTYDNELRQLGIKLYDWPLDRGSIGFLKEFRAFYSLCSVINKFKPDLVHAVALKPLIYSGFSRLLLSQFALAGALGGLGFVFNSDLVKAKTIRWFVTKIFRIIFLNQKSLLILQNSDDENSS